MKNNQFKIPKDYFNKFEEDILAAIEKTKKKEEFIVPENYFKNIDSSIFKKINKRENRVINLRTFSIAASIVLLIASVMFFKNQKKSIEQSELIDYLSEILNSDELDEMLLEKDAYFNDEIISDKEILNYIEENDITDDELYNNI